MQTLAFDGRMGASGDMLLGALLAVGADAAVLAPVEEALAVRYEIGTTTKCGIEATDVSVVRTDTDDSETGHSHATDNTHKDGSTHGEEHTHNHTHNHAEGSGPHRSYPEVVEIVESMELSDAVEQVALESFRLLGEAEARIHGTDLMETHFHEVGADDAIADVVGVALLLADLDPDRIVTTPLAAGGGTVEMSHGVYPVPTPAVVNLSETADWSLRGGPIETELLTPTGAALLAAIADGVETLPGLKLTASGYGAGDNDFDPHPNVLRALVGESQAMGRERVTVLETNLDDTTPEVLGSLQETLSDAGALDVSILPMSMKKSRPGHLVKVITAPEDADRVARQLAIETGTLGVREHGRGHRFVADRTVETVALELGGDTHEIQVKVASIEGEVFDLSAEYDDAIALAKSIGLSVREVQRQAEEAMREQLDL